MEFLGIPDVIRCSIGCSAWLSGSVLSGMADTQKQGDGGPSEHDMLLDAAAVLAEQTAAPEEEKKEEHEMSVDAVWIGDGVIKEEQFGKHMTCYRGFERRDVGQVLVGDCVYLLPAEPHLPKFIAQIKDLFDAEDGKKMASFYWYFRPEEIEIDAKLPIFDKEVFAGDEVASYPLDLICGRCDILDPKAFLGKRKRGIDASMDHVFVCSRKYVPEEGRVVPIEGKEDAVSEYDRHHILVNKKIEENPAVAGKKVAGSDSKTPKRAPRRKRKEPEQYSPERPVIKTTRGRVVNPPRTSLSYRNLDDNQLEVQMEAQNKPQKSKYGRWTEERYDAAQASLVKILKALGANNPHKAILRPLLREEARKAIGDTGLLDHLLKHLADQVVSPVGERLRRRHNREGHMEYWLQDPQDAVKEEKMLHEEMTALTAELREIREARNLIQTVRNEAADAIQTMKVFTNNADMAEAPMTSPVAMPEEINLSLRRMAAMLDRIVYDFGMLRNRVDSMAMDLARHEGMQQNLEKWATEIDTTSLSKEKEQVHEDNHSGKMDQQA
ncbi:Protein AMEIOTIC 1-like protein [Picochlorum sp. SENEW3]|nr:Protein AMEIOTIC 1-like protein [Picochlorum sp. SENEW3]WPT17067.1 Protein AMEIOTIC 1-like protein [Picochlorum sp. SENEW3]